MTLVCLFALLFTWNASAVEPKGVALLGHGLNNHYDALSSVSRVLEDGGLEVVPLILAGHNKSGEPNTPMPAVRETEWLADFDKAYRTAKDRAQVLHKPLYFVGYSLSGLVGLSAMTREGFPNPFRAMILLAPALHGKAFGRIAQGIPGDGTNVPSATPRKFRAHSGTSAGAYRSLYRLERAFSISTQLAAVPALVIMDDKDELVDIDYLKKDFKKKASGWQIQMVDVANGYHHLVVDPETVGTKGWEEIRTRMIQFLGEQS